jgi:hypothetical protein
MHPLDGVANECRKVLKKESLTSSSFGSDAAVANLLYSISKLRYKNGKGDPLNFKLFLESQGLPSSILPRYVGNRLNVLFVLAKNVLSIKDHLIQFLKSYCQAPASFRKAILVDLENPKMQQHLQVLGLLEEVLTTPWTKATYGKKGEEQGGRHLDFGNMIRKCIDFLNNILANPMLLQETKYNCFGDLIENRRDPIDDQHVDQVSATDDRLTDSDQDESDTQVADTDTEMVDQTKQVALDQDLTRKVVAACKTVISRQCSRYITGDLSEPTEDMFHKTANATHTNMHAERVLGKALL